jgi:hypothetical protein
MTLLVSGAGSGDQSLYGTPTVANVAQGAFAAGWDSLTFGLVRVSFDYPGHDIAFDFTVEYSQLASNVRLDFDANRPITAVGGDLFAAFGTAGIVNVAQGATTSGWDSSSFGVARASFDVAGHDVSLDLVAAFSQPGSNVGLYFDGNPLVSSPGVGLEEWIGTHLIYNNARIVEPVGSDLSGAFGFAIAINGELVEFDFTADYTAPSAANVRLDYDPNRPIPTFGFESWDSGVPSIVNVAQGAFEAGWESLEFGLTTRVTPPSRTMNLQFEFLDAYTPDTGANIAFAFGDGATKEVRPEGWDSLLAGVPHSVPDGYLYAAGFIATLYGTAYVENWARLVYPSSGWEQTTFGTPDAAHILPPAAQSVFPTGFLDAAIGTAFLSGGLRYVDTTPGSFDALAFGSAFIAYSERVVEVPFSFFLSWGLPAVDQTHMLTPAGFEATEWGTTYVHDNKQTVYAGGTLHTEFGETELTRSPRALFALGFRTALEAVDPSERWGSANLWNNTQIVYQLFAPGPDEGGVFGGYMHTFVENRNRTIAAYGHIDDRFPVTHLVDLAGRALLVSGFDAFDQDRSWLERNLIAYSIRHVTPEPIEPGQVARWTVVTKTPELFPEGFESGETFGTPEIVNTRRYYGWIGDLYSTEFGTAFIAPAVRSVEQYWPWEGRYGVPYIGLYSRYLEPTGIAPAGFGVFDVTEHHTTFAPRWPTRPDAFGTEIRVKNVTPEVAVYWWDQTEWGRANVFLQWRAFSMDGWSSSYISRNAVIRDRTTTIPVPTLNVLAFGPRTVVRNLIPDPPLPQTVFGAGFTGAVGAPVVSSNSLYPAGTNMIAFGTAAARLMGAIVPSFEGWAFGQPSLNATQWALPGGIKPGDEDEWSAARVDPFTIWCWTTPPAQAQQNNPGEPYELMDAIGSIGEDDITARPFFGLASIDLKNRALAPAGTAPLTKQVSEQGMVSNAIRYLRPTGLRASRYGYHMTNGEQYLDVADRGFSEFEAGSPTVGFPDLPYTRTIIAEGLAGTFGTAQVDLFNRELAIEAWDSALYGLARVHPPEPIIPPGLDATLFGDTMISFKIRTLTLEGWEEFVSRETVGYFKERMRVRRGV